MRIIIFLALFFYAGPLVADFGYKIPSPLRQFRQTDYLIIYIYNNTGFSRRITNISPSQISQHCLRRMHHIQRVQYILTAIPT